MRPTTAISAAVICGLILCVVVVVVDIAGGGGRDGAAAQTAGPTTVPPPGGAPGTGGTGTGGTGNTSSGGGTPVPTQPTGPCPPLTGGFAGMPEQEPSEIDWESYRGLAMPSSALSGPVGGTGSVSRCFARTPTGALLAAMQISSRALFAPDWRSVARYQLVPGPSTDEFVTRMTSLVGTTAPGLVRDVTGLMQPAGFKFLAYSPEQAVLALVFASEGGARMQSAVYTVVWDGDDWLLQVQPDGTVGALPQRPTSLDGFVPWGKE
ncbi:MAG TPA: hypothetical protein VLH10_09160 [Yinghuangia sp.]|uniref:hypothetical protein n=1 Tax=Yinghuangia sp. YIM S10712 TaxID=3436930 RepID=UPI002CCB1904|nr:hypothetical protein [Yinghuangia sp.]